MGFRTPCFARWIWNLLFTSVILLPGTSIFCSSLLFGFGHLRTAIQQSFRYCSTREQLPFTSERQRRHWNSNRSRCPYTLHTTVQRQRGIRAATPHHAPACLRGLPGRQTVSWCRDQPGANCQFRPSTQERSDRRIDSSQLDGQCSASCTIARSEHSLFQSQ